MRKIIQLLLTAFSVIIIAEFLPGVFVKSMSAALWLSLVLSVLNLIVRPVLIFLTLPITILTLGLFLLIINGLIINIADSLIVGFYVRNLGVAILFNILLSAIQSLINKAIG
ncbi:MAG: phage holin family protein [Wenyingzhuangia sp.]|jgi:putative membrane protein|uniref:phage holin family protein n=1 Tax=Wenyingzhuangia sp. TaxID=1964193 RepID=UPI003219CEA0